MPNCTRIMPKIFIMCLLFNSEIHAMGFLDSMKRDAAHTWQGTIRLELISHNIGNATISPHHLCIDEPVELPSLYHLPLGEGASSKNYAPRLNDGYLESATPPKIGYFISFESEQTPVYFQLGKVLLKKLGLICDFINPDNDPEKNAYEIKIPPIATHISPLGVRLVLTQISKMITADRQNKHYYFRWDSLGSDQERAAFLHAANFLNEYPGKSTLLRSLLNYTYPRKVPDALDNFFETQQIPYDLWNLTYFEVMRGNLLTSLNFPNIGSIRFSFVQNSELTDNLLQIMKEKPSYKN